MRNHFLSIFLGLTATVAVCTPLPVMAQARIYKEISGKENLNFNAETLNILESVGLSLDSVENTATPDPGYSYAVALLPPSSNPNIRGTSFTFSYDDVTKTYIPISGSEEFSGTIKFNVDTNKLALPSQFTIGGLSTTFGPDFRFFATDPTSGLRLFDVESSGNPNINLDSQTWTLDGLRLNFSQEFNDFLASAGAKTQVTGLNFANAQGQRAFREVGTTKVPEPSSMVAILIVGAALARRKLHQSAKIKCSVAKFFES
jgi:hypothetical protein